MKRTQRKTGRKARRTRRRAVARKNINRRMQYGGGIAPDKKKKLLGELAILEAEIASKHPNNEADLLRRIGELKISDNNNKSNDNIYTLNQKLGGSYTGWDPNADDGDKPLISARIPPI